MLTLDDTKWKTLKGGYRVLYDASVALKAMESGSDVWEELWNELHHQGDVDSASYAAIPQLVRIATSATVRDWNFYGLVSTIEIERHRKRNPEVPEWLLGDYESAWHQLLPVALSDLKLQLDSITVQAILSVIAISKGHLKLGALLADLDSSELDSLVDETFDWAALYG
jgi:hypothetical protein